MNPDELTRLQDIFATYHLLPIVFKPVVDGGIDTKKGSFLPKEPQDLVEEGSFNKVPFMIGFNKVGFRLVKAQVTG